MVAQLNKDARISVRLGLLVVPVLFDEGPTPIASSLPVGHALEGGLLEPKYRAGIKVEGDNRWLTIIQNASRKVEVT